MLGCIYLIVLIAAVLWIIVADRKPVRRSERERPVEADLELVSAVPAEAMR
ncbi:MAG: hypothetical protein ACOYEV_17460 [Candidatus Nanopelagicales bacterium]